MNYIHFVMFFSIAIGLFTGIIGTTVLIFKNIDAVLGVNLNDPEKDRYNFVILCPIEELRKKKYLIVKVKQS